MHNPLDNPILEQLVRRIEGDRQSFDEAATLLHAMVDRRAWRRLKWQQPANLTEMEEMLATQNVFLRKVTLSEN